MPDRRRKGRIMQAHLPWGYVQAIEALAGVNEIMALDKKLLFLEPVYCIPDSP